MAYELQPTPNYTHPNGNDDTSDPYDLTDGVYVGASHASDLSVTWQYSAAVRVDIDLERPTCGSDPLACHAIGEIFFQIRDQEGAAGIWCPEAVTFEVSDDGVSYFPVSRWTLPAGYPDSADCGAQGPNFNGRNYLISSGPLQTRGAHARVFIETQLLGGRFVFIDELEVRAGSHSPTLTNYLDNPVADYAAELDALGAGWKLFAVDPFDLIHSHSLPAPGGSEASGVSLSLAGGERGAVALLLTNPDFSEREYSAVASDLIGPGASSIPDSQVTLRQGVELEVSTFQPRSDALVLPEGARVKAAARSTADLWIDVEAPPGAEAGTYRGTLTLTNTADSSVEVLNLEVELADFDLPARGELPIAFFDWSYAIPDASSSWSATALHAERAAVRNWAGMNTHLTYHAPPPSDATGSIAAADLVLLGEEIDRYPDARFHVLFLGKSQRYGPGLCYPDPSWEPVFDRWIGELADFLLGKGLEKDEFAFYMIDEPADGKFVAVAPSGCRVSVDSLVYAYDTALRIKGVDPELLVWMNSGEKDTTLLSPFVGLVDYWVPPHRHFDGSNPQLDSFYANRGAAGDAVWAYNNILFSQTGGEPYAHGRLYPWRVWSEGWGGFGYWSFFSPSREAGVPTSLWNPFDGSNADWGVIYLRDHPDAPAGIPQTEPVIPSRRLAGVRQGIEDLRYLSLLQTSIDTYASVMDTSVQQATLNRAVADVLGNPEDIGQAPAARARISAAIETFADAEGDGWPDVVDNCPQRWNPNQSDRDRDGLGDACECPSARQRGRSRCRR
jgi:hypothetical protein